VEEADEVVGGGRGAGDGVVEGGFGAVEEEDFFLKKKNLKKHFFVGCSNIKMNSCGV